MRGFTHRFRATNITIINEALCISRLKLKPVIGCLPTKCVRREFTHDWGKSKKGWHDQSAIIRHYGTSSDHNPQILVNCTQHIIRSLWHATIYVWVTWAGGWQIWLRTDIFKVQDLEMCAFKNTILPIPHPLLSELQLKPCLISYHTMIWLYYSFIPRPILGDSVLQCATVQYRKAVSGSAWG